MTNTDDKELRHNRRIQVSASFFSKLADALINTKVVLPAILNAIAAPAFLIGLVAPIREAFSMLPQMLIKSWVANSYRTNLVYSLGGTLQALSVAMMLVFFLTLQEWAGGIAILSALLSMSLARSLCSLSSKTVLGSTVPKSSRGNLMGIATSLAGVTGIGVGVALCFYALSQTEKATTESPNDEAASNSAEGLAVPDLGGTEIVLLLFCAAIGFAIAGALYTLVRMPDKSAHRDNTEQDDKPETGALRSALSLIRYDKGFRNFVITRALMMISALAMPFAASIALANAESVAFTLGLLIALEGCSASISGRIWGDAADKNSRAVLLVTASVSSAICLFAALDVADYLNTPEWSWIAIYLCLSLVHQGVRLGRKTYIVDLADEEDDSDAKRAEYVAVSNTAIGILLLVFGLSSALLAQFSMSTMFIAFAISGVLATILASRLKSI